MKDQAVGQEAGPSSLLITVEEAARRLSIGRSHIYLQIQTGALRSIRIGRSRRILRRDLEAFVESQLAGSAQGLTSSDTTRSRRRVKRVPTRSGRR